MLATLERFHWSAACPERSDLLPDHNEVILLFDQVAILPDIEQAALSEVLRRAVRMSVHKYVCVHIRSEDPLWADFFLKWTIILTTRGSVAIPPLPRTFHDFEWPSTVDIPASHTLAVASPPQNLVQRDDALRHPESDAIWLIDGHKDLQFRPVIIERAGLLVHGGSMATEHAQFSNLFWFALPGNTRLFVQSFTHFLPTTVGERITSPFGPSMRGTQPDYMNEFDYTDLGVSFSDDK